MQSQTLLLEPLLMSALCCVFFNFIVGDIFHLDVQYVRYTMLVQRFEPQGRRFTNSHYYYCSAQKFVTEQQTLQIYLYKPTLQ